jgi:hypothetical protein
MPCQLMTTVQLCTPALAHDRLLSRGWLHLQVSLNGKQVPVTSFPEYCELYLGPKENGMPRVYGRINNNWEVCITASDSGFKQVRPFGSQQRGSRVASRRPAACAGVEGQVMEDIGEGCWV